MEVHAMKMREVDLRKIIERYGYVNIYLTGDWQLGTDHPCESTIKRFVKSVEKDRAGLWFHHGDYIEGILPGDRRYDVEESTKSLVQSIRQFKELVRPITKKCIGILYGNHEAVAMHIVGNLHEEMCSDLGVWAGGISAGIVLRGPGWKRKWFAIHGGTVYNFRAPDEETRWASTVRKIRSMFAQFSGDILGHGHSHALFFVPPSSRRILDFSAKDYGTHEEYVDHRWYYCSGTMRRGYFKGHSGYEESMHAPPLQIGYLIMTLDRKGNVQFRKVEEK
jgi:hypothetical protein